MSADSSAAQTRVRVNFRQVREALAASEQADQVFEGLLVACVELQDENDRLWAELATRLPNQEVMNRRAER